MAFDGIKTQSTPRAIFVPKSKNAKIGSVRNPRARVATTYASIKGSCPKDCARRVDGSCYAKSGPVHMYVGRRLDAATPMHSPLTVAREEAAAIDAAFPAGVPQDGTRGGRDLRLHTSGDCSTPQAARIVGAAAQRYRERNGGAVWTYTHAWRDVAPSEWGQAVSVLASLDNAADANEAHARGYAPARVVASFPEGNRAWTEHGVKWIACPAQTRDDTGCADCRLCLDASALHARRAGIAFEAHGTRAKALKRRLQVVS